VILAGATLDCVQNLRSGSFQQAANPDQNYRANKRYNDGTYYAAAGPDSQNTKEPPAQNAAEDSENDVHEYAVTTTLHNLPSKPACNQSNYNPSDESHVCILLAEARPEFPIYRPADRKYALGCLNAQSCSRLVPKRFNSVRLFQVGTDLDSCCNIASLTMSAVSSTFGAH
jgi:hypothetical protein